MGRSVLQDKPGEDFPDRGLEVNSLLVVGQAFQDYFELVTTTEAFKYLSQEKLVLLLSGDGLNVSNEQTVVQSLETWFSAVPEERTESLQDLLCFV